MTPTATVTSILFIHLGVILVVTAYYAMSAALAPQITYRAQVRFAKRPWLPALIGIGLSIPWVTASLVLMSMPLAAAKFAGAVLGCLWILCGLVGGASIAQQIGLATSGSANPSWIHSVRGGLFLTLTWVLPLVGWMGMLPLTLATGVGCLLVGLFPMRHASINQIPSASTPDFAPEAVAA